jgi:hypothetical protein
MCTIGNLSPRPRGIRPERMITPTAQRAQAPIDRQPDSLTLKYLSESPASDSANWRDDNYPGVGYNLIGH